MPEPADKTTEVTKPKPKPDDGTVHTLTVFAQSLAYTAVEAPMRGLAQIADHALPEHIFGTKLDDKVQHKFDNMGVHKIDESTLTGHAYAAATLGNAVGIVLPMKLSRMTMVGRAEGTLTHAAEGNIAKASILDGARHEAYLSAKTGLLYGAILSPTENNDSSGNFLVDRTKQGFHAATTFGIMGSTAALSSGALGRVATGLEHTAMPGALKSTLQTALHSNLVHGVIGGIPGGLVQAQLNAIESGKPLASAQEFKDSVISMTAIGGVMGSAGLFKESTKAAAPKTESAKFLSTESLKPLVDNIAALRSDSVKHADKAEPLYRSSKKFDIKYDPIESAWKQEDVDRHKTTQTRQVEFAAPDRESKAATSNWEEFKDWGVERRNVSASVYKFPGLSTEIVVPSDYAAILDKVRENRLNPDNPPHQLDPKYNTRVLPEELAQVYKQLPNADLVKSVQLLDHANPYDLKSTRDDKIELEKAGTPDPSHKHVALANADMVDGIVRIFDSSTNKPAEMFSTGGHEWSHMAEDITVVNAFPEAAHAEQRGFFYRKYAQKNNHENFAVHTGERFLNPSGSAFAELPEKAPARTLIMAKAVRNTLEARADNPSPHHQQLMDRVAHAETRAAKVLQKEIRADIASGDTQSLNQKLEFLTTAASAGQSPEIFDRVLKPLDAQLVPILEARPADDKIANLVLANRLASQIADNPVPEKITELAARWKKLDTIRDRIRFFEALPESGQKIFCDELIKDPPADTANILSVMHARADGNSRLLLDKLTASTQVKYEQQGIALSRENKIIPEEISSWMFASDEPEARLAVLKSRTYPGIPKTFNTAITRLDAPAIRQVITGDVMAYIADDYKAPIWHDALSRLPQNEQVNLFRSLAQQHDPAYAKIANQIESMGASNWSAQSQNIADSSLKILLARESTPEFVLAHPLRIKDATSFLDASKSLSTQQTAQLIENGGIRHIKPAEIKQIIARFADNPQIIAAIKQEGKLPDAPVLAGSASASPERQVKEFKVLAKNSRLFERASLLPIEIPDIQTAWSQDRVDLYKTSETRKVLFAKEGREARAEHEDWDKFENWGVEEREVPVDVYRFPGVKTEIVVPSEYARKLDEARERRLNPPERPDRFAEPLPSREYLSKFGLEDVDNYYHDSSMAANDNHLPNTMSILPEELAQMITQMPNPDLIARADLYEHAHPWDMHQTHENELAARAAGKAIPGQFIARGSAETETKHLMFWKSATNSPSDMQWLSSHEWAHLLHDTPAYKAFAKAALIEQNGFYSRDYATTHEVENWAVHLGEQFLNPRGSTFAHFVHEAPARALVMSKAVRDMLNARQDNPSPRHAEFLARVDAADKLATNLLRQDILKDIKKGDADALNTRLQFLNAAASEASSPEFLSNVLGPIDAKVMPALLELSKTSAIANETIANRMVSQLSANYSPEQMPAFIERYRDLYSRDAQVSLYNRLPEAAQHILYNDLAQNPQLYKTTGLKDSLELPKRVASTDASTIDIVEYAKFAKPSEIAHPLDIKFEPGDNAWPQARIDQYKTRETRSIEFAAPDRDDKSQTSNWSNFREWGVQSRETPVDVYRFPGLKAEIVVPSDYARVLDQLRAHRLSSDNAIPPPTDSPLAGRSQRVLPEEVAQMLAQMPQPDIVKTVELLDHANPNDMRLTREKIEALKAEGKTPPPEFKLRSLADASINGAGRMRIFDAQTNNPVKLQEAIAHEWSHIAQAQPAFAGFESAATADGKTFYARAYAKENIHENWAVHLGERILGPRGSAFAEIPEKAPARTIVMAKALRNMLEQRKDNPTPRHAEFMARVQEAENTATTNFQLSILTDIIGGDHAALDTKLRFVNTAALASSSPEMHANILGPVHTDLMKALSTRQPHDQIANSIYANQLATEVATNYTPESMQQFSARWKMMSDARLQAHLFKMIPEVRQKELLADLAASPAGYDRNAFEQLKLATDGQMQNLVQQTFSQAQSRFEKEGMKLDRANKPINDYVDWLRASTNPDARMVPLKHYNTLLDAEQFEAARAGLPALSTRDFIRDGALAYVKPDAKPAAWAAVLQDLSQAEQVKLFRDLSAKPTSAFSELAKRVEKFDAGEFEINAELIRDKSFALLQQRERSPEFITAHPHAIKDADAFLAAIKTLSNEQITAFIKDGALDKIPENDQALVINKMSRTRDLRGKLDMLAALEPSLESKERIDLLADLSTNQDPVVAAKAQRLLIDIADAQLATLQAKAALTTAKNPLTREERMQRHEAFLSFQKLQRKMFELDDARARIAYLKSTPQDANGNLLRDKFSAATFGLPDDQIIEFLKSGIVDRLPPADRTPFLRDLTLGRSNAVKTQAIAMELAALPKT